MPFPDKSRIIFKKNPLDRVVCQLRFPTILKIDSEIPAEFQEMVRNDFPIFNETVSPELSIDISPDMQSQIPPNLIKQLLQPGGIKNYEFKSEDNLWTVSLTRTFIALSVSKYERWEQFKSKLELPLNAFNEIYSPIYYSRIGLRYTNIIKRSNLMLNTSDWQELINPVLLGMLSTESVRDSILNFENKYELKLSDDESMVRIITSMVQAKDTGEICYEIDSDHYCSKKIETTQAFQKLDFFNSHASKFIQWCITDKLLEAMDPEEIEQ